MNTLIIVFSATGNTRYGAMLIKKGLEHTPGNTCDIIDIRDFIDGLTANYDLVGFASPVFAFKPALIMLEFIENMLCEKQKPCFTFVTHAGITGTSNWLLAKKLKNKGYIVINQKDMLAQGSWTTSRAPGKLEFENEPSPSTQEGIIEFGKSLNRAMKDYKNNSLKYIPPRFKPSIFHFISLFYNHFILDRFFVTRVDENKCIHCGFCIENCPEGRMNYDKFPNPKGRCIGCYKCINLCPKDAVDGWLTKGKLRYKGL